MKKIICIVLALSMLFAFSLTSYAESKLIVEEKPNAYKVVDRFFEKEFQMYNSEGEDISSLFYSTMTNKYDNGNYEEILAFLKNYVVFAESFSVHRNTDNETSADTRSINSTESATWDFYQIVDDQVHGYTDHNVIFGTADLEYQYNSSTGLITSINALYVDADLMYEYGDLSPSVSVTNRSYSITGGGTGARYSFKVSARCYVQSDLYGEVNQMDLAFRYSASFSHTISAGD